MPQLTGPVEDGDGLIVRLYQSTRSREWVTLRAPGLLASAAVTNLLEDDQQAIPVQGNELRVYLTPFQILTVRLRF